MKIVGYLQTSLIEWPGKISSVIFTSSCNFRCPFCHNRDLVDPSRIKGLKGISDESIFEDLARRKKWVDGVVVTGGEPLLQEDLGQFLNKLKQMGLKTMVETNGSLYTILQCMISQGLVDYVVMDYKTTFMDYPKVVNTRNKKLKTGEANLIQNIKKSMSFVLNSKIDFEFRTTVVPGIHDEKVLVKMAKDLRRLITHHSSLIIIKWILQTFQPKNCLDPEFNKKKPYTRMEMKKFLKAVKRIIPSVEVRDG